jgi:hypothetical protein
VVEESAKLKHSLVLAGMFRFESASQFTRVRYHSVESYALNMEDLIYKKMFVNSISKKIFLTYFSVHFTKHLTDPGEFSGRVLEIG